MERNNVDVAEMSVVEELTKFIEKEVEINFECVDEDDESNMETSEESAGAFGCAGSSDGVEKCCTPFEEMLKISKTFKFSPKKLRYPWEMNSKHINESLLKTYISEVVLQGDSTDSTNSLDQVEDDTESFGDMHSLSDSDIENEEIPTIDLDQEDLGQFTNLESNMVEDSSSEVCLLEDSSPLPEAFNGLVCKTKDVLQKIDELLEAMDSRPHWNRIVGKSNSPWKLNNTHADLDSGMATDKKPKILKQWADTKLKFSRLSAILKESLLSCTSSSEIMVFLADLKSTILQCFDFNKVQDCSNLTENIQTAFDADSDVRYMLNLERRILTIEVTLKNMTFEIDRICEDYEKEKKFQIVENVESE